MSVQSLPIVKPHHSLIEDTIALVMASLFVSLGLYFFNYCGLLMGGVTGIAMILQHFVPFSFGQILFTINMPFYVLAWLKLGPRFTVGTAIAVTIVSFCTDHLPFVFRLESLNPYFAAVAGGLLIGMGVLIMFRHLASFGGLGILASYLQSRFGISAGRFQMGIDLTIVMVGYFLVSFDILVMSIIGAIALNSVIALSHKPGRYQIV